MRPTGRVPRLCGRVRGRYQRQPHATAPRPTAIPNASSTVQTRVRNGVERGRVRRRRDHRGSTGQVHGTAGLDSVAFSGPMWICCALYLPLSWASDKGTDALEPGQEPEECQPPPGDELAKFGGFCQPAAGSTAPDQASLAADS
uniref:(northern house mosquito) hypothetical protein n=1 Tax=Culex pipiens TaxID=7175 RepID=A0A8D8G5B3_CULPI